VGGSAGSFGGAGSDRQKGRRHEMGTNVAVTGYCARFRPLLEGVTIKRVIWTGTDLLSTPQLLPFKFKDMEIPPLPSKQPEESDNS
jgi:hypothetical protein